MTNKLSPDFWAGLFSPIIAGSIVLALAPLGLIRAFVLVKLWAWYVVPAFEAQPLRLVYAFGFCLIVGYLSPTPPKDDRTFKQSITRTVVGALIALLIGWAGSWFV